MWSSIVFPYFATAMWPHSAAPPHSLRAVAGSGKDLSCNIVAFILYNGPSAGLADPILAAVDDNGLARNECSIVARQEQDCARHILRLSQPLDRLLFPGGAFLL